MVNSLQDDHFFNVKIGRYIKIPRIDMVSPPIVPAASGNQNASLSGPSMNGMNPSIVEITVRKIGVILAFHAFRYNHGMEKHRSMVLLLIF